MNTSTALKIFQDYEESNPKPSTLIGYRCLLDNLEELFVDRDLKSISSEELFHFLEIVTENNTKSTKRHRYSQLKAFRLPKPRHREIIPKEVIDEVIFNSKNLRDRLLLELQSRCGARIGEALNIRVRDIDGRKITVRNPKSGKESEVIFMPEPVADKLKAYIREEGLSEYDRVFNLCYTAARTLINRLGEKLGRKLNPHDLRRHSATYASRNGVPLEIISKVLLPHQNLKTTQVYLGTLLFRSIHPAPFPWFIK